MKKYIKSSDIFGMANLNPQKAGLGNIVIWSDHSGVTRSVSHRNTPRVKMAIDDKSITVTISDEPKILGKSKSVNQRDIARFQAGIDYVARNWDIFLKHYNDITFDFDDEAFYQALRERGEYN